MGLAASRAQARQLIRHAHVGINGKKVSIPSVQVRAGDKIEVREPNKKKKPFRLQVEAGGPSHHPVPAWLESDLVNLRGSVIRMPLREDIPENIQEQLIVELYSK
jgi:small subunit ribosomal protein S4